MPAINTSMEHEMNALCPFVGPFAVARVPLPAAALTIETLPAYGQDTLDAVASLEIVQPDLVVHGCTAAGLLGGSAATRRIMTALEKKTGATVVGTSTAMVDVLRSEGIGQVAVLTPYPAHVNEGVRKYLADEGIEVEVLETFDCRSSEELVAITGEQVFERALKTVTSKSKSLFIACSQLPTLDIIDPLRQKLGIPVWSSVTATGWAVNRTFKG